MRFIKLHLLYIVFSCICLGDLRGQEFLFKPLDLYEFAIISSMFQDSRGFVWIGTYAGLYKYDGYELEHFYHVPGDSLSIGDSKVGSIVEDNFGNLWLGTQAGIYRFDVEKDEFTSFGVHEDKSCERLQYFDQKIYFLTNSGAYSISTVDFSLDSVFDLDLATIDVIPYFFSTDSNNLWFNTGKDLYHMVSGENNEMSILSYDTIPREKRKHLIYHDSAHAYFLVEDILCKFSLKHQEVQLLDTIKCKGPIPHIIYFNESVAKTEDLVYYNSNIGLIGINLETGGIKKTHHIPSHDMLIDVLCLNSGQVWLGTATSTIYSSNYLNSYVYNIPLDIAKAIKVVANLFEIYEYQPGELLVPSEDGFPVLLDIHTGEESAFPAIDENPIRFTCFEDADTVLWIGSDRGVSLFDKSTMEYVFHHDMRFVRDILLDREGTLWIATWYAGSYTLDPTTRKVEKMELPDTDVYNLNTSDRHLYKSKDGHIWIGTRHGLYEYEPERDTFYVYTTETSGMSDNTAFCVYEDSLGYIWFGTYGGGLNRLDRSTGKCMYLTKDDGLVDNNVLSLIPDKSGHLWLATFEGITKFNPYDHSIVNYKGGAENSRFMNTGFSAFMYGISPGSGHMFFGSDKGIDFFHPDSISLSDFVPPLHFTGLKLLNEMVPIGAGEAKEFTLDKHYNYLREIELSHEQNVLTIEYAAIDLSGPTRIEYAYMLDGFDEKWQYVGTKRDVTYTNLDPGAYTFKVKSTNADGVWQDNIEELSIEVLPAWWETGLAYMLYVLGALLLITTLFLFQRRRLLLRAALSAQSQEATRLKELDRIRTNLYTTITHEFRTPLTLISGMTDLIRRKPESMLQTALKTIDEQSEKLLYMVNQILTLQKIDGQKLKLELVHGDIVHFLDHYLEPFYFYAKAKDLSLQVAHYTTPCFMDFDEEKLGIILSNLLSNAIKFTQKGEISVSSTREGDAFLMTVSDTGRGIKKEDLDKIFTKFYQVDSSSTREGEGSGIGLALVKEFVKLMKGNIEVQSRIDTGTTFVITLPIQSTVERRPQLAHQVAPQIDFFAQDNMPEESEFYSEHILIVEDHAGVRNYLQSLLSDQFGVSVATNGQEGLEYARTHLPSLIISDVMMPVMDGYMLCRKIKEEDLTAHIPMILLTAKSTLGDKIEGLNVGADLYVNKPFQPRELFASIHMLVGQRRLLHEAYSRNLANETWPLKEQDPIVKQLKEMVLSDLENATAGMANLCKQLGVSRTKLHNKVKATTGLSSTIYIRKIRLQKANHFLMNSDISVSEVAYRCGFKDPNFFSRVFKREYGVSPSSARRSV